MAKPPLSPALRSWLEAGRRIEWQTHPVFLREDGQGPTLVCIHGFPTASWDWHAIWPELRQFFRLVAPDLLGFGFSAKPRDFPYSIMRQADLVEFVCARLGVESAHLLAHDYGDTVAQELLARRMQSPRGGDAFQIRSVCFLNGGLFPDAHRARFIQKLLASPLGPALARFLTEARFRRSFAAIFAKDRRPTPEQLADFWKLVNFNDGRRVVSPLLGYIRERKIHADRWIDAVTAAPVPVRFVNGLQDPVSGRHMAERYRRAVANPDLVEIPESGHYPQLEAPEKVIQAVLEFTS